MNTHLTGHGPSGSSRNRAGLRVCGVRLVLDADECEFDGSPSYSGKNRADTALL
ncbi:hypothetical protein [Sphaerimonospora mesophila]|uniref:hypothetical protein n=1 Tax=Sphaerimonospora mesophila TaxID=37483 RepID=UPI000A4A6F64